MNFLCLLFEVMAYGLLYLMLNILKPILKLSWWVIRTVFKCPSFLIHVIIVISWFVCNLKRIANIFKTTEKELYEENPDISKLNLIRELFFKVGYDVLELVLKLQPPVLVSVLIDVLFWFNTGVYILIMYNVKMPF
jgi:hypothetical protein